MKKKWKARYQILSPNSFCLMPEKPALNYTVAEGHPVTMMCDEEDGVGWYFDSVRVETVWSMRGRVSVTTTGELTIDNVEPDDAGLYECRLTTGHYLVVSALLDVTCRECLDYLLLSYPL